MLINALICDDEQKYIDEIAAILDRYCADKRITYRVDSFTNGEGALNTTERYNIAFLDIEIDSVTGLEIARRLKERNRNIIIFFITAYDQYIDEAMDLFAIRYIQKPMDADRLYSGLDTATALINDEEIEIYLRGTNKMRRINSADIVYIEINRHKTIVVTEQDTYTSPESIDYWERRLTNICFGRPHKSFIVNMEHISSYNRSELTLANGKIVPIAYRRQTEFRTQLLDYLDKR